MACRFLLVPKHAEEKERIDKNLFDVVCYHCGVREIQFGTVVFQFAENVRKCTTHFLFTNLRRSPTEE